MFSHSFFGWCAWDLPSLVVCAVIMAVFIGHRHNQKKREKDFQKELEEVLGNQTEPTDPSLKVVEPVQG